MKRRIMALLIVATVVVLTTACGKSLDKEESDGDISVQTEQKAKDLPEGNYQDTGSGQFYLVCASGTSENGNVPVIYADRDTALLQIEMDAWEFEGSKLSYVYVDGMLVAKEQFANTQSFLDLTGDMLSEGVHKVEVLQYESDDVTKDVVTYKSGSYEIKSK